MESTLSLDRSISNNRVSGLFLLFLCFIENRFNANTEDPYIPTIWVKIQRISENLGIQLFCVNGRKTASDVGLILQPDVWCWFYGPFKSISLISYGFACICICVPSRRSTLKQHLRHQKKKKEKEKKS